MKNIIVLLFFCSLSALLLAQSDSSAYEGKAGVADVAESDPGLFLLMMFMLMTAVVAVLICLTVGLAMTGAIALMIAGGIVTLSAFMAWYYKSIYAGVKWFIYLSFTSIGVGGAIAGSLLVNYYVNAAISTSKLLLWCIPAGAAGGLLAAFAIIKISNKAYQRILTLSGKK